MDYCYCPYCMGVAPVGQECPNCRNYPQTYAQEAHHFPVGYLLAGRYVVGKVLGEGGFGITYLGLDTKLERRVAIKEYFPRSLVHRDISVTCQVTGYTGSENHFEKGRAEFLREAQVLAKLDAIPEIVHVLDYFSENNSAYIVMEFLEGMTLKDYLASYGVMEPQTLLSLLEPVLTGLDAIHKAGLIHRDISPDNLMILSQTGKVKLMDFGCAREVGGGHTMTVMLKPGFAPVEQYTGHEQGPWSDIYALCATIYYGITGRIPPVSMQRAGGDTLIPLSQYGIKLSQGQGDALMKGLAVHASDRYTSVAELYGALYGKTMVGFVSQSHQESVPQSVATGASVQPSWGTEYVQRKTGETEYLSGAAYPGTGIPVAEEQNISGAGKKSKPQRQKRSKKWLLPVGLVLAVLAIGYTVFVAVHDHTFGQWSQLRAANCTQKGLSVRKCSCGMHEITYADPLGHTPVVDPRIAPSCTAEGKTAGSHCAVCSEVLTMQEVIPKAEHRITTLAAVAPTCTEKGFGTCEGCADCDYRVTEPKSVPATGHKEVADPEIPATCKEAGKTAGSHCEKCNKILVAQKSIEKGEHVVVIDKAVEATCTKEGKTEGSHCSVCETVIVKQESTGKASGHKFSQNKCKNCGVKQWSAKITLTAISGGFRIKVKVSTNDPGAKTGVYIQWSEENSWVTRWDASFYMLKDGETYDMEYGVGSGKYTVCVWTCDDDDYSEALYKLGSKTVTVN